MGTIFRAAFARTILPTQRRGQQGSGIDTIVLLEERINLRNSGRGDTEPSVQS